MTQDNRLDVILDVSGSMDEMGKKLLTRNLAAFIREFINRQPPNAFFTSMSLTQWNKTIEELPLSSDLDIPEIQAVGKADITAVKDYLKGKIKKNRHVKVVILTDGYFSQNSSRDFRNWIKYHQQDTDIRFIAIGADASLHKFDKVYLAEDISTAIRSFSQASGETITPPASVDELYTQATV
jgi:hypothetical protein